MDTTHQILFFFGLIGAFNALFLSIYFAFFVNHNNNANYYLSATLFVVGVKIITSVFLYFDNSLLERIVEIGLSANTLIGPLFYFYVKTSRSDKVKTNIYWWLHIIPAATAVPVIGLLYPSTFNYEDGVTLLSQYIVAIIYFQWFVYLVFAAFIMKSSFKNVFQNKFKSNDEGTWLVSLFLGISLFWIGPIITSHTTYMIGATSFSIIFHVLLFLWIFKFRKTHSFFHPQIKYPSKKISPEEADALYLVLNELIRKQELFRNPNLRLVDVANELKIPSQHLSQFLNDNLGKSFSLFINEYRIEFAKKTLLHNNKHTLEAIGYESGFNSKSTFYSVFKKQTELTPSQYKNQETS